MCVDLGSDEFVILFSIGDKFYARHDNPYTGMSVAPLYSIDKIPENVISLNKKSQPRSLSDAISDIASMSKKADIFTDPKDPYNEIYYVFNFLKYKSVRDELNEVNDEEYDAMGEKVIISERIIDNANIEEE